MRGQGKFLAFWAPKGVLSFFHHKFLGIPTNITLSDLLADSDGIRILTAAIVAFGITKC
jgi:hypothetical protein